jgi:hypothetical protein
MTQPLAEHAPPVQLFISMRAAASTMAETRTKDPVRYAASAERLMHLFDRIEDSGLAQEITEFLNVTYRG